MNNKDVAMRWLALPLLLAIAALAGAAIDRGGVARGIVANGHIRDIGTLRVAGVDYDVSQAKIIIDGVPGAASELRQGQLVELRDIVYPQMSTGPQTLPTVGVVTFRDAVQGPISKIRINGDGTAQLTVLGQLITVNQRTRISAELGGNGRFQLNQRIEVSGYAGLSGRLLATRIDPAPAGAFEVTGEIVAVRGNHLVIGDQLVDFSNAVITGFGPFRPRRGDWVEVRGVLQRPVLQAIGVSREDRGLRGEPLQEIDIEGLVTEVKTLVGRFEVDGTPVELTEKTVFIGGTFDDVIPGRLIEVEGEYDEYGRLVRARHVRVGEPSSVEDDGSLLSR
ncbi:MAG: DUF5666 domain-containing protein [Pseudomonadota bacterium]